MSISILCECGKKLKAPDNALGRKAKCPVCGAMVTVEQPLELKLETRPFRKDPVVIFGASVPAAILLGFFGYLWYTRSIRVSHEQIQARKAVADARVAIAKKPPAAPHRNPKIPIEVSYPIVEDDEEYNQFVKKRMVRVNLNMRVSREVIEEIAKEVKATERHQYERTFIFYYLPVEFIGVKASPFANSHFNPVLDVSIMGTTPAEFEELKKVELSHPGVRIGAWFMDSSNLCFKIAIYEEAGQIKMVRYLGPEKPMIDEMVELPAQKGRRFHMKRGSDIYEIDKNGDLRLYADDGDLLDGAHPLK